MKFALFLSAFLAIFSAAFSSQSVVLPPPPGKPGFCWSDITGPMEKGEEKIIENQCKKGICNEDKTLTIFGCGASVANGIDVTGVDLSKPYPKCCP